MPVCAACYATIATSTAREHGGSKLCQRCYAEAVGEDAPPAVQPSERAGVENAPASVQTSPRSSAGRDLLTIVGILAVLVGLWFLLVHPGDPSVGDVLGNGREVVNLQRLAVGQAFTVAGSVFLAAAWRPR